MGQGEVGEHENREVSVIVDPVMRSPLETTGREREHRQVGPKIKEMLWHSTVHSHRLKINTKLGA